MVLPTGMRNVFEGGPRSGVAGEVLADSANWINSMDLAIERGTFDGSHFTDYAADEAIESGHAFVTDYHKHQETWTGVTRYYDRQVQLMSRSAARLTYCGDESKAFTEEVRTHRIHRTTKVAATAYVAYETSLKKNARGIWQTVSVDSERGAARCQP
ncbi:hypothetical protein AB0J21_17465 [Streptomyces sp. NPDC049954]|uniref:hypothetical protein n=1 Tax=Streptomyces sp. NPDC049954 TaxID=3155779 RepID=UPI00341BFBDD